MITQLFCLAKGIYLLSWSKTVNELSFVCEIREPLMRCADSNKYCGSNVFRIVAAPKSYRPFSSRVLP
jgi:hypothetical protein